MARPLKRNVDIHFRVPSELKRECIAKAASEGETLTTWVEKALRTALATKKQKAGRVG